MTLTLLFKICYLKIALKFSIALKNYNINFKTLETGSRLMVCNIVIKKYNFLYLPNANFFCIFEITDWKISTKTRFFAQSIYDVKF